MENHRIAIIGLGYVGLPLAIEFAKHFEVVGYDINESRIAALSEASDLTREVTEAAIKTATAKNLADKGLTLASDHTLIAACDIYIITVPTPVDAFKSPDLTQLLNASRTVGKYLAPGNIVIYESTVYPGCTEEECVPVLEQFSGLKFNSDFFCGYSPERINPGDKVNTLTKIKKVTSGSTAATAREVNDLYALIIEAGTYLAPSIKVAEASKAIENAQRDVNISFINELALIFDKMGIDTHDVIEAAATKWNFLNYKPGLVGGHCIGVDPYYLAHKAESLGYHPQVILSGRRVNDNMGIFIANKVVKLMISKGIQVKGGRCLILGFTFKENCADTRNTRVIDVYHELIDFGMEVTVYDPWADPVKAQQEYNISISHRLDDMDNAFDAMILTVAHDAFRQFEVERYKQENSVVFDTKAFWDRNHVDARL